MLLNERGIMNYPEKAGKEQDNASAGTGEGRSFVGHIYFSGFRFSLSWCAQAANFRCIPSVHCRSKANLIV